MFAARLICALGLAAGAFCQTYVQFSVDQSTFPQSINENGEIAGYYLDFASHYHGFVRDPVGTITTFDVPGSSITQAFSINDEGAITGSFTNAGPRLRIHSRSRGELHYDRGARKHWNRGD
jgi:hypothetical protein